MGRPVDVFLFEAEYEARRYVQAQYSELRRIGYPSMATFAKNISNGGVSCAPTPADPKMGYVFDYLQIRKPHEREVIYSFYSYQDPPKEQARQLKLKYWEFNDIKRQVLEGLAVYLIAKR